MSRAFIKEDADAEQVLVTPRPPLPEGVDNLVTPAGLAALEEELAALVGDEAGQACTTLRTDGRAVEIDGDYTETLARVPVGHVRWTRQIADRSLARAARKHRVSPTAGALPFGIGATLGFASGRLLAQRVIDAAESHLGPPPEAFADAPELVAGEAP